MLNNESKSQKFNKILQDIEKHANKSLSLYRNESKCNNISIDLRSPQLFKDDTVKEHEIHKEVQTGQIGLQSVDSTSHHATHRITNTLQTEQDNEPTDEGDRANDVRSASIIHREDDVHNEIDSHRDSSHTERINFHIRADEKQKQISPRFQGTVRPSYFSERSSSSEHYPYPTEPLLSNEVEVHTPSFMNTITSTLKNVDPVPVVGVSGGMGALFLLFRYTPVGTFFRGRGYRQRIPTRFDGVYQGFLPGFPSLEEEDTDNESLLDSMEYIKDFSQVFKDLKKGIFQMIKLI
ncbi:hypothetical protein PVT01_000080600 [Plasmodium vivax]|uniref:VIR protein n=1 Tax=Plasmodium vivax TaxID=5855 RepID=A0A1G4EAI3_PLAVI|nr:hypothetical protein PVT01_000080600 [Plasmodium vivax]